MANDKWDDAAKHLDVALDAFAALGDIVMPDTGSSLNLASGTSEAESKDPRKATLDRASSLEKDVQELAISEANRRLADATDAWRVVEQKANRYTLTFPSIAAVIGVVGVVKGMDSLCVGLVFLVAAAIGFLSGGCANKALRCGNYPVLHVESVLPRMDWLTGMDGDPTGEKRYRGIMIRSRLEEGTVIIARTREKADWVTRAERTFNVFCVSLLFTGFIALIQGYCNAKH